MAQGITSVNKEKFADNERNFLYLVVGQNTKKLYILVNFTETKLLTFWEKIKLLFR